MPYLLDTDWALDAFKRRAAPAVEIRRLAPAGINVSRITVIEIYEGAFSSVDPQTSLIAIRRFISAFRVLDLTDPIGERFADLRAYLRRRGERIPDFDLLIAATALHHDLTLLTFNRQHFERVPGLRIYQTLS